jgi:hypothetical protein
MAAETGDKLKVSSEAGEGLDPEKIGKWLGVLNQYITLGWFTQITEKAFPDAPSSIIRTAQRQALRSALIVPYNQRIEFPGMDERIVNDMHGIVRKFDKDCLGIETDRSDYEPSVDVENWQPMRELNMQKDIDEGRFRDINLARYPDFNDHKEQLALFKLSAMQNALNQANAGKITVDKVSFPGSGGDQDIPEKVLKNEASFGLQKYKNRLEQEMLVLVHKIFSPHPEDIDYSVLR